MKRLSYWALAGCLAAAGCGGSSGGTSEGGGNETEMGFGTLSATGFVTTEPVTANTSATKYVGLVGSFSRATLENTNPTLDDSVLAFTTNNTSIYTVGYDGKNEQLVVADRNGYPYDLQFNNSVTRLYYVSNGFARYVNALGGNYNEMLDGIRTHSMDLSPDGTKMLTTDYSADMSQRDVWRGTLSGGGRVRLTNDADVEESVQWVNATTFAYEVGGRIKLRNMDGSNVRDLNAVNGTFRAPRASPDGQWLAYVYRPDGGSRYLVGISHLNIFGTGDGPTKFDLGADARSIAWAPDGQHLAALDFQGKVHILTIRGEEIGAFTPVGDQRDITYLAWSPFIQSRALVGTGGLLGTKCNGIIFSQAGASTKSVAVFNAVTAATAKVSCDDQNSNTPTVVYTAEADRINKIAYNTDSQWRVRSITTPAGINGAMISFDSATGMVSSVLTYAISRSGRPKIVREGATVRIEGEISNVYDSSGKDLGPASQVTLNSQGGVSVR
jgi:WD40 repeat protein